jgi:4-amino-4-deoxy-L-arabinose transferase-like glycosyltransferase
MYQFFIIAYIAAMLLKSNKTGRDLTIICILGGVAFAVILPWTYRNYLLAGRYIGTATGFGLHYLKGERNFECLISGGNYLINRDNQLHEDLTNEARAAGFAIQDDVYLRSSPAVNDFFDRLALEHIRLHPWRLIVKAVIRFPLAWFQQQTIFKWFLNVAVMAPLLLMAGLAAWRERNDRAVLCITFLWCAMNGLIAMIFPEVAPMRYVLPLLPLIAILACRNYGKAKPSTFGD